MEYLFREFPALSTLPAFFGFRCDQVCGLQGVHLLEIPVSHAKHVFRNNRVLSLETLVELLILGVFLVWTRYERDVGFRIKFDNLSCGIEGQFLE